MLNHNQYYISKNKEDYMHVLKQLTEIVGFRKINGEKTYDQKWPVIVTWGGEVYLTAIEILGTNDPAIVNATEYIPTYSTEECMETLNELKKLMKYANKNNNTGDTNPCLGVTNWA